MNTSTEIGKPVSRLEGPLKVTGKAKYAAEYYTDNLAYGYIFNSTITKGKILSINTDEVKAIPGVVEIYTHENAPSTAHFSFQYADMDAPRGTPFKPLDNNEIKFNGQPIGIVIAETFELAAHAASLIKVEYQIEDFETDIHRGIANSRSPKIGVANVLKPMPPKPKGDFDKAYQNAEFKTEQGFFHGTEHHNPMELFAATVVYEKKGKLTIYDKTQGTINSQLYVANVFGLHFKDVRVIAPYVGGGFGSGLRPQHQLFFAALSALGLKRSVRVVLDRKQMFSISHRPQTIQNTRFAADKNGRITALGHYACGETSRFEDYAEIVVNWSNMLYPAENTLMQYKLSPMDIFSPGDMRAPGGCTGIHPIECTMDALSYELKTDPLDLRIKNYAEKDDSLGRPFSSKELMQCYLQGAEKFGWKERHPEPRSMKRGHKLVGYGMATGVWEAMILPAKASMTLLADGTLEVSSAVTDIGTGTLTVMSQIAADELGLTIDKVKFIYGDSKLPFAPIQGGSFTVSTVGSAIKAAGKALRKKIWKLAKNVPDSPLKNLKITEVFLNGGKVISGADENLFVTFSDIFSANEGKAIKVSKMNIPNPFRIKKFTRAAHSAAFVEVEVDEELGVITVTRALTAVAAGKIVNPKTARSQLLGGMVWGISKALREETICDHNLGRYMNTNMGEYHIPVHADINELDVIFVEEDDKIVNELGSKGLGEIGIVALPPAIANAVFHATGKRINKLPIHFDDLL